MIIYVCVKLNEILEKGRGYPWPKPEACPKCGRYKVWGHGFVEAFFDGFDVGLPLRRYRCPDCKTVIRMRPREFFSRFQAPIAKIRSSISNRAENGGWLAGLSRTRQAHWYRALKKRLLVFFGVSASIKAVEAFDFFVGQGKIPVSRSM